MENIVETGKTQNTQIPLNRKIRFMGDGFKIFLNLIISILLLSFSCETTSNENAVPTINTATVKTNINYTWTKLLDSAIWEKNYNFQMLSINDTLWTFHPDGNWHSTDGKMWTKSVLTNPIWNHAFLDYVYFKGAVFGLGYLKGNIESYIFKPEIYKTVDRKNWTTISITSNLPHRFFYHPFVFDSKIWIIGGEDKNTKYNDIWNSEDGITWVKQKDNLPFGKRSNSWIVTLNNTLYLLNNDVWSSKDGINWQKVTAEIVNGEQIFGYAAVVFDEKIWLIGCDRNGEFSSQVLFSSDGKNWQADNAPWLPRGGIAATVHKGKIYMTGGKYGGTIDNPDFRYDNDVWILEK